MALKSMSIRWSAAGLRLSKLHNLFISPTSQINKLAAIFLVGSYVVALLAAYPHAQDPAPLAIRLKVCDGVLCVSSVSPGGPGWLLEVEPGMSIGSLNGETVTEQNMDILLAEPFKEATFSTRSGEPFEISGPSVPALRSPIKLSMWALGAVFASLGALVILRRVDLSAARLFSLFAWATAILLAVGPSSAAGFGWARILTGLALVGIGASLVTFAFSISVDRTSSRSALTIDIFLILGLVLVFSFVISLFLWTQMYSVVRPAVALYAAVSILLTVGLLVAVGTRQPSPAGRQQARIILWGLVLGTLPFVGFTLLPLAFGQESLLPGEISILAWGLVPASFAYAILQYQLLGIRRLVHRGIVYGLATVVMLIVVGLALSFLPIQDDSSSDGTRILLISAIFVVGIAGFWVLRRIAHWTVDNLIYRDVTDYQSALKSLQTDLPVPARTPEMAQLVVDRLARIMDLESALLFLGHEPAHSALVASAGERADSTLRQVQPMLESVVTDSTREGIFELRSGSDHLLLANLTASSQYLGYVLLGPKAGGEVFVDEGKQLLQTLLPFISVSISKSELTEELRGVNQRLVRAEEDERARVAADLHDGPLQKAMLLTMTGSAGSREDDLTRQLISELREICSRLRPAILDDLGIVPALEWLLEGASKQFGLETHLSISHLESDERFLPEIELALFRITQEAINNVFKHAQCTLVDVSLSKEPAGLVLNVADDGVGFDQLHTATEGLGLSGMRERVMQVGGSFRIHSVPELGTTVTASIPLS